MDDFKAQAMLQELEAQRAMTAQLYGTRCAELAVALATANQRIKELENPPKRKHIKKVTE